MQRDFSIPTPDGTCDASLHTPAGTGPWPAVIMFPDAGGVRATFHSLRHTYAIFLLATLTRRLRHEGDGHVNAVKTLQLLLGHASLQTTSTYLNAVRLDAQLLSGSINDLYQALQ